MNLDDVKELHYIAPVSNLSSIMEHGLLCHRLAEALPHESVAMTEIQAKRAEREVPPGHKTIHDYVNLYFHARNPMMFKLHQQHRTLTVLRIDPGVLALAGVIVTDGNAASKYTRFMPANEGVSALDKDLVFALDWTSPDEKTGWIQKSARCAEVLVPDEVPVEFLSGAYVSCEATATLLRQLHPTLATTVSPGLFFQGGV